MARSSNGRMRDPHSRDTGSTPVRVTLQEHFEYGQVAELADARRSERRARSGVGVQLSPWLLQHCRCGRRPVGFHKLDLPGSIPGPATCCGWASAQRSFIRFACRVRPPDPLLHRGQVRKQAKRAGLATRCRRLQCCAVRFLNRVRRAWVGLGEAAISCRVGCAHRGA